MIEYMEFCYESFVPSGECRTPKKLSSVKVNKIFFSECCDRTTKDEGFVSKASEPVFVTQ